MFASANVLVFFLSAGLRKPCVCTRRLYIETNDEKTLIFFFFVCFFLPAINKCYLSVVALNDSSHFST